jgi:chorismate-pyruvate lyase
MISAKSTILTDILTLEGSTTLLLECLSGMKLQVEMVLQSEEHLFDTCYIKRITKLFFDLPELPALFCISYLEKKNLTSAEYQLLMQEDIPIGRLFIRLNNEESIRKNNISIVLEEDEESSHILKVNSSWLYKKQYDYWIEGRKIGNITEMFNEESLNRIYNKNE